MSSAFFSSGARLAFRDTGSGPALILLHPTPLDSDYWQPVVDRLSGFRCISLDFRGHGGSELGSDLPIGEFSRVPDAPVLTIARLAQDVLALIDHLRIDTATFAGCSIGGYTLLELWRRAPRRIRGLAFVCSKPQPDAEANLARRAETIARIRNGESAAVFDGLAHSLTGSTARATHPEVVSALRASMTLTPESSIAVQAGLAVRPDSVPTVSTISVPILAVCGGEDGGVTPAEMQAFQSAPGRCEYHLIPDAGHLAAYEQPDTVASLIGAWAHSFKA